jgi:glucose/arabinose dehydrogenase
MLLRTLIGFVVIIAVTWLFVRYYVGAVNLPLLNVTATPELVRQRISVPDGFSISLWADEVPNARVLRMTRGGDLLVAIPWLNQIMLLERDRDGDGKSDGNRILMADLNDPNGLDFYQDWLYIAEEDAVGRVKFDHMEGNILGAYERIVIDLPDGGNHYRKGLRFGPDGNLYVSIGSSCNVCVEEDERRAAIMRYKPDGSGEEIYANGLRNSVGFDWSPVDGLMYATDNGRDLLGDDFPPCELNQVSQGQFYGWPVANGDRIADPDYGDNQAQLIEESISPVHHFRAHNAPLGIVFLDSPLYPPEYQGAALVALHGSWNRSQRDGYKVVSLHWNSGGEISEKDFVTGFLSDGDVIGRPTELAVGPNGSIYIADDFAGVVYRVVYGEEQQPLALTPKELQSFDLSESLALYSEQEQDRLYEHGKRLFDQYACVTCHNDEAGGKKLENLGERFDVIKLNSHFTHPPAPMPAFPLSEDDKSALAIYVLKTF